MPHDFRARVVRSARAVAAGYLTPPYPDATVANRRLAAKILNAHDSDLVFTDLMMRLDYFPGDQGTDEEITWGLKSAWGAVAAEFDPGVDPTV